MTPGAHTLAVYGASQRGDAVLQGLAEATSDYGGRLTVVRLVAKEPEGNGCCDTRSVYWNDVMRGLAREDLARAQALVERYEGVELDVLAFSGRQAPDEVIREALARDADAIVLTDARAVPIGVLGRRRLRRKSPVPVHEDVAEPRDRTTSAAPA